MKKLTLKLLILLIFTITSFSLFSCKSSSLENKSKEISTYNLDLDFDNENKVVYGKETIEYLNVYDNTLSELCFHLYPNAFREDSKQKVVSLLDEPKAYPNGKSYGNIKINDVKINSNQSTFEISGEDFNILKIKLNEELYPNDKINIYIDFETKIPNINHRFGYGKNTINLGNFYPIACVYENGEFNMSPYSSNGDPFYSQMSNYKVNFNCPNNLKVATTGKIIKNNINESTQNLYIEAKVVRDFAMTLSDKFNVLSKNFNGVEVQYFYYNDKNPEKSLTTSIDSIETFSKIFGEYPYNTLSVAETNFIHGGMEYPNLVFISDSIENYDDYTNVIIHEIAHQWWYNIVGNDEYSYSWLDEGLTEFSTALFYKHNKNYNRTYEETINSATKTYQLYVKIYGEVFGSVDTSMNRNLSQWSTEPEYVYITYIKGMLLFSSLYEILGETEFLDCIQDYYKKNKFAEATPANLISSFEKCTSNDIENFFNSWINGKVIIETLS